MTLFEPRGGIIVQNNFKSVIHRLIYEFNTLIIFQIEIRII